MRCVVVGSDTELRLVEIATVLWNECSIKINRAFHVCMFIADALYIIYMYKEFETCNFGS